MGRLQGKIAVISGTATGQGRTAALLFAAEGATVIGCDIKSEEAQKTLSMVREAGGTMLSTSPIDLGVSDQACAWIQDGIRQCGSIDILYNNAGAVKFAMLDEMTDADWRFTQRNELDIVFYTVRAAWPFLIAGGGGAIINTSSTVTRRGSSMLGAAGHTAAKAGVIALTRQIAAEGARHKIRANSISSGLVETPATAHLRGMADEMAKAIPLGRWGQPEDIAYCALYLASDEAKWVTAADFTIDGGMTGAQ